MVGSIVGDVTLNLSQMEENVPIAERKTIRIKSDMTDPKFDEILEIAKQKNEENERLYNEKEQSFYRFFAVTDYATGDGLTYFLQISRNCKHLNEVDYDLEDFKNFISDDYYFSSIEELQEEEFMKTYANLIPPHVVKMVERKDQPGFLWQTHFYVNYS